MMNTKIPMNLRPANIIHPRKIIECETGRMTNFIIIATLHVIGNIIVRLKWSDPLNHIATLYIIHANRFYPNVLLKVVARNICYSAPTTKRIVGYVCI